MSAASDNKAVKIYPKYHRALLLGSWDKKNLVYRVEKTREKGEMIDGDTGKVIEIKEKWQIVPYYEYDDGKTDRLVLGYDAVPLYIAKTPSSLGADQRKIYARMNREREVYKNTKRIIGDLVSAMKDFILTEDCSKVLSAWNVSALNTAGKIVNVTYSAFIQAHLSKEEYVTIIPEAGKKKVEKGKKSDEDKVLTSSLVEIFEESMDGMIKTNDIIVDPEEENKQPTKYILVTTYPTKPNSASEADVARFDRAKVEGSRKVCLFLAHEDAYYRFKAEGRIGEGAWLTSKSGSKYTTDYHVMKHIAKGFSAWAALDLNVEGWRISVGKETGKLSFVLEEGLLSGTLLDIRPSDIVKVEDARAKAYIDEYAGPANDQEYGGLDRLASGEERAD
jgi:hypothetical protein